MDMIRDFVTELSEDPDIVDIPNDQDEVPNGELPISGLAEDLISLESRQDRIEDLKGILTYVKNACGVSMEDIALIETNTPGFKKGLEKDRVNLNQFTRQRSKVGYGVVQEHLNRAIRNASLDFKVAFEGLFCDCVSAIERLIHEYDQYTKQDLDTNLQSFYTASESIRNKKSFSGFVFTTFLKDEPFLNSVTETFQKLGASNFTTASIKDQDHQVNTYLEDGDQEKQSATADLCQKAAGIYDYCDGIWLMSFLEGAVKHQSYTEMRENHSLIRDSLSLKCMLERLLFNDNMRFYTESLSAKLQELLVLAKSAQKEIGELENNHEEREGFLLQNHSQIHELMNEVDFIREIFFTKGRLLSLLTEYTRQVIKVSQYR